MPPLLPARGGTLGQQDGQGVAGLNQSKTLALKLGQGRKKEGKEKRKGVLAFGAKSCSLTSLTPFLEILWELLARLAGMSVTVGGRKCGSLDEALAGAQAGDTIAISGALSAQQLIIPAHLAGQPHPRYLSRVSAAACVMLSLALLVQGWWLPGPEARPSRWTRGPSCRAPRLASRSRG